MKAKRKNLLLIVITAIFFLISGVFFGLGDLNGSFNASASAIVYDLSDLGEEEKNVTSAGTTTTIAALTDTIDSSSSVGIKFHLRAVIGANKGLKFGIFRSEAGNAWSAGGQMINIFCNHNESRGGWAYWLEICDPSNADNVLEYINLGYEVSLDTPQTIEGDMQIKLDNGTLTVTFTKGVSEVFKLSTTTVASTYGQYFNVYADNVSNMTLSSTAVKVYDVSDLDETDKTLSAGTTTTVAALPLQPNVGLKFHLNAVIGANKGLKFGTFRSEALNAWSAGGQMVQIFCKYVESRGGWAYWLEICDPSNADSVLEYINLGYDVSLDASQTIDGDIEIKLDNGTLTVTFTKGISEIYTLSTATVANTCGQYFNVYADNASGMISTSYDEAVVYDIAQLGESAKNITATGTTTEIATLPEEVTSSVGIKFHLKAVIGANTALKFGTFRQDANNAWSVGGHMVQIFCRYVESRGGWAYWMEICDPANADNILEYVNLGYDVSLDTPQTVEGDFEIKVGDGELTVTFTKTVDGTAYKVATTTLANAWGQYFNVYSDNVTDATISSVDKNGDDEEEEDDQSVVYDFAQLGETTKVITIAGTTTTVGALSEEVTASSAVGIKFHLSAVMAANTALKFGTFREDVSNAWSAGGCMVQISCRYVESRGGWAYWLEICDPANADNILEYVNLGYEVSLETPQTVEGDVEIKLVSGKFTAKFTKEDGAKYSINTTTLANAWGQYFNVYSDNVTNAAVSSTETPAFNLSVTVGEGGTVSGNMGLEAGKNATLTFLPQDGYGLDTVMVDGVDVTENVVNNQLVLENVQKTTVVAVTFKQVEITYGTAQFTDIAFLSGNFTQTVKGNHNNLCSYTENTAIENIGLKFRWKANANGFDGQVKLGIFKTDITNVWSNSGYIIWVTSGQKFNLLGVVNGNAETSIVNDISLSDVWNGGKLIFEVSVVDKYADGVKIGYVLNISVNGVLKVQHATSETVTTLGGSFAVYNEAAPFEMTSTDFEVFNVDVVIENGTVSGHLEKETNDRAELTITPNEGYSVQSVKYNGTEIYPTDGKYILESVQPDDTVVVTTAEIKTTFTLNIATVNGSVSGNTDLAEGSTAVLVFTPIENYYVKSVVYNGEDVTDSLVNNTLILPNIAKMDTVSVEFAEIVVTYGTTVTEDFYDVSGTSTKQIAFGSNKLGKLQGEARNAGLGFILVAPADGFNGNMKFGLYKTNDENSWALSGFILYAKASTKSIQLMEVIANQNEEAKRSDLIDLSDVWDGGQLEIEVGVVTKYENGVPAAYTLTITVNGTEKISYAASEKISPLGSYFNVYCEEGGNYLITTTKEMISLNVTVVGGTASGLEFIAGTSPVIMLNPDEKTYLKSATLNGENILDKIVAVGGNYEYRTETPTASDVVVIVFEKGTLEQATVADFYDLTGMVSMKFETTMDNYGLGYITKTGNDAILMKVTLSDTWNGRTKIGAFKSEGAGDIWAALGFTVEIRSNGKFYLYTPNEVELDSASHEKIGAGKSFIMEMGIVKYMGDGVQKANYYYVKVDGVEIMYYLDYSMEAYGTKVMLPMLEDDKSFFTLSSAYNYYNVSVNEAEGLTSDTAYTVKEGETNISLALETGYEITAITANGADVSANLTRVSGGYTLALNVTKDIEIAITTALKEVTATFEESENVTITLDKASVPMGGSVVYTIEAQAGYTVTTVSLNGMDVTDKIVLANGVYTYTARGIVEDVKLIVTVEAKTYTVSVTAGEGGSVTPDTASVVANGSVVLTVTENDGYQLKTLIINGKSVSLGVDGTYTVKNILEEVTVVATFEKIVTNIPDSSSNSSSESNMNALPFGCGGIAGLGATTCLLLSVAALMTVKRKDNDLD